LGILVFRFSLPTQELRAFSVPGNPPTIAFASGDVAAAQSFSLIHEWCHLLVGRPGLCKPNELSRTLRGDLEVFANAFAGAFLAPSATLLELPAIRALAAGDKDPADAASDASRMLSVSRFVVLRRLLRLRLVSSQEYNTIATAWLHQPRRTGGRHVEPAVKAVRELGQPFVAAVLEARQRGALDDLGAADHLSLPISALDRVAELAAS
jgi:Zn-dependent peptidase ImmA (M78 family)